MIEVTWVEDEAGYGYGKMCKVGKWVVGGYHHNSLRSRDDPKVYQATCRLPGVKNNLGDFETENAAKNRVDNAVRYWFAETEEQEG